MMKQGTLEKIHCPLCGFSLKAEVVLDENADSITSGVLRCRCRRYPLVDGILVLDSDNPVGLQKALRALTAKKPDAALVALLEPHSLRGKLLNAAYARNVPFAQMCQSWHDRSAAAKARRVITAGTCLQALEGLGRGEYRTYFQTRFSSASFIAGIALLGVMRDFSGPILEFGCGAGHHAFILAQLFPDRLLTLTDHSFINLYLAKRFFAPQAECICLNGNYPLPFADRSFQTLFSSDALHYIDAKVTVMSEMERILQQDHLALFSHLHNRFGNDPASGSPLSGEEWKERAAFSEVRLLAEKEVFDNFYRFNKLDLTHDCVTSHRDANAFSLVVSDRGAIFKNYPDTGDMYFALQGRVVVNPLFRKTSENNDGCHYRKQWPSGYFKNENTLLDAVFPEAFILSKAASQALERNDGSFFALEEARQLIRKFLVIHIPAPYV